MSKKIKEAVIIIGPILWVTVVLLFGLDIFYLPWKVDFASMAQFGDSFGVMSALMATAAAYFTYTSLVEARVENKRLLELEKERKKEDLTRRAEETFFKLLEFRMLILENISVADREMKKQGMFAFDEALQRIYAIKERGVDLFRAFNEEAVIVGLVFGHYFRSTRQIIEFVESNFVEDKGLYIDIVRSQMSNVEKLLLGFYSIYGADGEAFRNHIENYHLLNGLSEYEISAYGLNELFD